VVHLYRIQLTWHLQLLLAAPVQQQQLQAYKLSQLLACCRCRGHREMLRLCLGSWRA
jgi:hypothetical protein